MWQRFTERARKVVFYAQEEAQKFGEGFVSTEHILLGLIRESDSTAAFVIERLGASLNRIRSEVEKQLPRGEARPSQDMTLTPRAKRVIDLAYDEARHLNHNYIGTEHLLLGLIREGDGLAGKVLAKLGLELERARGILLDLGAHQPRPDNPAEPATRPGFTETLANHTLIAAKRATEMGNPFYSTADLLREFLVDRECFASRLLQSANIDLQAPVQVDTPWIETGVSPAAGSPMVEQVQREALRIAREMSHARVGTGHVLLAGMKHSGSEIEAALVAKGANYERMWILLAQLGDAEI